MDHALRCIRAPKRSWLLQWETIGQRFRSFDPLDNEKFTTDMLETTLFDVGTTLVSVAYTLERFGPCTQVHRRPEAQLAAPVGDCRSKVPVI